VERDGETIDAIVPWRPAGPAGSPGPVGPLGDDEPLATGTLLGSFRVVRVLGEGGMGRVYLAVHEVIGRRVALKVLRQKLASDPRAVSRFFVEAQLVNRIRHPGIVEVTDLFVAGGMPCIVMELLEGRTFGEAIAAGELTLPEILDIGAQIADALRAAHEAGVVHRDLKPDNVLLVSPRPDDERGQGVVAKVLDFGIAKLGGPGSEPGALMGTPEYMSPEQLSGAEVDARVDIYALGVSLFHATVGRLPFSGEVRDVVRQQLHAAPPRPSELADVPDDVDEVILTMLAKNPAHRPQTMAEVAAQLRALRRRSGSLPPRAHAALGAAAMSLIVTIGAAAWVGQADKSGDDPTQLSDAAEATVDPSSDGAPDPHAHHAATEPRPRAPQDPALAAREGASTADPMTLTSHPGVRRAETLGANDEAARARAKGKATKRAAPLPLQKRAVIDPFAEGGR
jgi:serine/threonine protein kinase